MNDDGSGLEESSELIEMIKKFPTAAFVAGRLKEVGWESDYEKSLLDQFREDLIQECGDELSAWYWNIFGLFRSNRHRERSGARCLYCEMRLRLGITAIDEEGFSQATSRRASSKKLSSAGVPT
jgi:hypothetical protein